MLPGRRTKNFHKLEKQNLEKKKVDVKYICIQKLAGKQSTPKCYQTLRLLNYVFNKEMDFFFLSFGRMGCPRCTDFIIV